MTEKSTFLVAKRPVDDRAIDHTIWQRFLEELEAGDTGEPVRIVEAGTGVGTMVARLAEWAEISRAVSYRGVDVDPDAITVGKSRLPEWLSEAGYDVHWEGDTLVGLPDTGGGIERLEITLEVADATAIDGRADAVVAAALLDIVEQPSMLLSFRELLTPGGVVYAPLTFDGGTRFSPTSPHDERIERLYHRHMDEIREVPGGSESGRELLEQLPAANFQILESSPSAWEIDPAGGGYAPGDALVLDHLLETIDAALSDFSEETISEATRAAWIRKRRQQLSDRALSAEIDHLDILAKDALQ